MSNRGNSASRCTSRQDDAQIGSSDVLKLPAVLPKQSNRISSDAKESSRPSSATTIPKLPDIIPKPPSTPQLIQNQYHSFLPGSNISRTSSAIHDTPQQHTPEKVLQPTPVDPSMNGEVLTTVANKSAYKNIISIFCRNCVNAEPILSPELVADPEEPDDKNYDEDPIILIFLDKNAHDRAYRMMFEKIEHRRLFYFDPNICMNDNRWTVDTQKKIFLITSGSMFKMLNMDTEQVANKHPNIDSIFIFCAKREVYEHLLDEDKQSHRRPTLKGIFTDLDKLLNSIEDNFIFLQNHLRALQNFSYRRLLRLTNQYPGDISSFFLMKNFLLDMPNPQIAEAEMLLLCRGYFYYNPKELAQIEEFRAEYVPSKAIWWFTRDSFVYRMLNMALQSENIQLMYTFRFLIRDLSRQLRELQLSQRESIKSGLMVYRGGSMLETELNAITGGIGYSFLANGYLSASPDRNVAYQFAQIGRPDMASFLLEIEVPYDSRCVFADIQSESCYQNENEVIFDIGIVLKVIKVSVTNDANHKIHIIRMVIEDSYSIEQQCREYLNVMRSLENCSEPVFFGKIIQTLGMCSWLREYSEQVLSATTVDSQDVPNIRYILSCQSRFFNNVEDADKHHSLLKQLVTLLTEESPQILNIRGELLQFNGELSLIGDTYEKALSTLNTSNLEESRKQFLLTAVYMNVGGKLMEEGAYDSAREQYEQAQKMYIKLLPPIHPLLADVWISLGNVYRKKNETTEALSCYEKAHILYQQWLPSHHPSIAYGLSHMGLAHHQNGSFDKAHDLYQQAFKIYSKALSPEHPNVQLSRYNGQCSKYELVLDYYIKYPCF
jgi:tetratricopeptide (TPR) repeat protein